MKNHKKLTVLTPSPCIDSILTLRQLISLDFTFKIDSTQKEKQRFTTLPLSPLVL